MKLDIRKLGKYEIITIEDDLSVMTDLSELRFIVNGYIQQGRRHIVIQFNSAAYVYSGALGVLVECHKQLAGYPDGALYIIEPNQTLRNVFDVLDLDGVIKIYDSVKELPVSVAEEEFIRRRSAGVENNA